MAEIIVEPTALSKVIPLKFKINDVDVPKTTQLSTNKQFNTTDTDAWFTFELDGLAATNGTYDLTLINLDDKSIFHHDHVLFPTLPFHYKLNSSEDVTLNEIRHAGRWLGQLVVTLSNGDTTARQFGFNIAGHILDGQDAQVILLSDYQALINTINLAKDDLAQYNVDYAALLVDIAAAEDARVTAYNQLLADQQANIEAFDVALDDGIVAANLAQKLQDFEATNNSRLLSAEQQLADIVTDVKLTQGADSTAIIQAALNKKGHVRIVSQGTFLTGQLIIDSDTKFELLPGVKLKKKDGANSYILTNKANVDGVRNKNIHLIGGEWDMNSVNNPDNGGDSSVNPLNWSGIGILFNKVDNLTITDIADIGNEWKYCFLIADINGLKIDNITMHNESDGLHFQPPLKNVEISNIGGVTHDDLISFTMGDYNRYAVGKTGHIENVEVINVYGGEGTDQLIKLVGDGLDGLSKFKNMRFSNLGGYAYLAAVNILKDDQAAANDYLHGTHLENVVFENIDVKVRDNLSYFAVGASSGDITIRKLKVRQEDTSRPIWLNHCNMAKVVIEDMIVVSDGSIKDVATLINIRNSTGEIIDQLIIKDSNINYNSSADPYIIYGANQCVKDVFISNVVCNAPMSLFAVFEGVNTDGINMHIDNSRLSVNYLSMVYAKLNFYISNSRITTATRTLHLMNGANVRIVSSSSDLTVVINGMTASRFLSLSGDLKASVLSSLLSPQIGDRYFYDSATDVKNRGVYLYDGTKWVKWFSLVDYNATVTAGTLAAQSTTDFLITIADIGNYKSVMASPQFALPTGVVYSVTHLTENGVRLRLANITAAPVVFDPATQIAWNFKVIRDSYIV